MSIYIYYIRILYIQYIYIYTIYIYILCIHIYYVYTLYIYSIYILYIYILYIHYIFTIYFYYIYIYILYIYYIYTLYIYLYIYYIYIYYIYILYIYILYIYYIYTIYIYYIYTIYIYIQYIRKPRHTTTVPSHTFVVVLCLHVSCPGSTPDAVQPNARGTSGPRHARLGRRASHPKHILKILLYIYIYITRGLTFARNQRNSIRDCNLLCCFRACFSHTASMRNFDITCVSWHFCA